MARLASKRVLQQKFPGANGWTQVVIGSLLVLLTYQTGNTALPLVSENHWKRQRLVAGSPLEHHPVHVPLLFHFSHCLQLSNKAIKSVEHFSHYITHVSVLITLSLCRLHKLYPLHNLSKSQVLYDTPQYQLLNDVRLKGLTQAGAQRGSWDGWVTRSKNNKDIGNVFGLPLIISAHNDGRAASLKDGLERTCAQL